MKILLYCTKSKPYLKSHSEYEYNEKGAIPETRKRVFTLCQDKCDYYNGKIVAECDFEVEEIKLKTNSYEAWFETKTLNEEQLREKSCLRVDELYNYLEPNDNAYAIHIKNLHIFDEPRNIRHYDRRYKREKALSEFKTAPKSMIHCFEYIRSEIGLGQDSWLEDRIFVPISSKEMCRILNKKQTIIVRKKILKEMLK